MQKESMRPTQPNRIEADGTEYGMEWYEIDEHQH